MNPATKIFLVGAAFVLSAGAQARAQARAQANAQAATPKSALTVPLRESWVRVASDPRPEPTAGRERESEVGVCRLRDRPGSDPIASSDAMVRAAVTRVT
jgi:hypothetical protein